jgi:membrane protein YqaA with SNARE-associated domain
LTQAPANPAPPAPPAPPPPAPKPVPRWALHRRLYDWTAHLANTRHATWLLALVSFCEAIFFPIPPLVMQVPMTLERRRRAWFYATVLTATSVLGGIAGFYLGHFASEPLKRAFPGLLSPEHLEQVRHWTDNLGVLTAGAIAVHPYKLYTIALGILGTTDLAHFIIASLIGRALLFYGVAALLYAFGPPIKHFIDRYFNLLTILLGVALLAFVLWTKLK